MKIFFNLLGFFALCMATLLVVYLFFRLTRTPDKHVIPQGYVGKITLYFNEPGKPPLPRQGGYNVIRYDGKGNGFTSSGIESGWAKDLYVYVTPEGKETELGDDMTHAPGIGSKTDAKGNERHMADCFIGTPAQAKAAHY